MTLRTSKFKNVFRFFFAYERSDIVPVYLSVSLVQPIFHLRLRLLLYSYIRLFQNSGPTASIFYGIRITQSGAMVFIFNLDKVLLK